MSYAVGAPKNKLAKGMGYTKINEGDNESGREFDVISPATRAKQIEQRLKGIQASMRQLENMCTTIGTEKDSKKFRTEVATALNKTSHSIREVAKDIDNYSDSSNMGSSTPAEKKKQMDQGRAFKET